MESLTRGSRGLAAKVFSGPKLPTAIRVKHAHKKMFVFCRLQI
jgi:hypothetical protein